MPRTIEMFQLLRRTSRGYISGMNICSILTMLIALGLMTTQTAIAQNKNSDEQFGRLAEEYLKGHLAWRPQAGTTLGFHEFDGKVTDFSKASLDAELTRLQSFDRRLAEVD